MHPAIDPSVQSVRGGAPGLRGRRARDRPTGAWP